MTAPGSETAHTLQPGTTLARFSITRFLGRGGMGEVYLADDPVLNRSVALKILTAESAGDPDRRSWFQREATSAAALNHTNICTIFEVGDAAGRPFIAMEAIEGRTLRALIHERELTSSGVIEIALQIASALEHARERHVVHRDLKSANIMVTPAGAVKVLDFGLAKRVLPDGEGAGLTTEWVSRSDLQIGTLPYMSPEQALARPVDHRSDLFSFGVILHECLTGRLPFVGKSTPELLDAILHREPPPIERPIPSGLHAIVAKLLRKQPIERYQSAGEVIEDLRAVQETGVVRIAPVATSVAVPTRRPAAIATGAAAVVAIAAALWWGAQRGRPAPAPALPAALVVVPATVTGPAEFQYLSDAIPASLTARLTGSKRLRLKMPPSATEFAQVGGSLQRVSQTYGVTSCIVPHVTVADGRLTLVVQIVDAATRDVLWSGEYQSTLDRYGQALAQAADGMRARLVRDEPLTTRSTDAADTSAFELAIGRGRYNAQRFNAQGRQEDFVSADAAFEEALRIEPRSSSAAAERAYLQVYAVQAGRPPEEIRPQLELWARRALDADSRAGLAWAALVNAELWRSQIDLPKLLDYGFRAAAAGEDCGRCQFGLVPVVARFSQLLKHHVSQHQAEVEPLYANAILNSAVALTALGRTDAAASMLAQARAIDPNAVWLLVHEALLQAAAGAMRPASVAATLLVDRGSLKALPAWIPPMITAIQSIAKGDEGQLAATVQSIRAMIREKRMAGVGVQYVMSVMVPMLARQGHPGLALDLLVDATGMDAPPPYDMLVLNPLMKRLMEDPRARDVVVGSRAKFDVLLRAVDEARSGGRFPAFLEQPLQEIRATSNETFSRGRTSGSP